MIPKCLPISVASQLTPISGGASSIHGAACNKTVRLLPQPNHSRRHSILDAARGIFVSDFSRVRARSVRYDIRSLLPYVTIQKSNRQ